MDCCGDDWHHDIRNGRGVCRGSGHWNAWAVLDGKYHDGGQHADDEAADLAADALWARLGGS